MDAVSLRPTSGASAPVLPEAVTRAAVRLGHHPTGPALGAARRDPRLTAADRADFQRVVLSCLDAAYNLARWLVREPALAEDVVQEASLRAWTGFGSFRGENPRAWFLRIVRNTALNAIAARQRRKETSLTVAAEAESDAAGLIEVVDPAKNPEATLALAEDRSWLEEEIAALPKSWRECLILREFEELSYKEIARITDIPVGTVMSRLWRARQALLGRRSPRQRTEPPRSSAAIRGVIGSHATAPASGLTEAASRRRSPSLSV